MTLKIAWFITSHGYGHAARSAALMRKICTVHPKTQISAFTGIPYSFFEDSGVNLATYMPMQTDVGLVQTDAFAFDVRQTCEQLSAFIQDFDRLADETAEALQKQGVSGVVCDISIVGIEAAKRVGIPSILTENFTWDWIYEPFIAQEAGFKEINSFFAEHYAQANHHALLTPFCVQVANAHIFPPVFRKPNLSRNDLRQALNIKDEKKIGLISMGGIPADFCNLQPEIFSDPDFVFLLPGASDTIKRIGSCILLPHRSKIRHTDLMFAPDFLIGKAGYSTIAENRAANIPFGYLLRAGFRESIPLRAYLQSFPDTLDLKCNTIAEIDIIGSAHKLLELPQNKCENPANGASTLAEFILQTFR